MKRTNRAVYLVLLLIFAVVMTTALVLAGERSSGNGKTNAQREASRSAILR